MSERPTSFYSGPQPRKSVAPQEPTAGSSYSKRSEPQPPSVALREPKTPHDDLAAIRKDIAWIAGIARVMAALALLAFLIWLWRMYQEVSVTGIIP